MKSVVRILFVATLCLIVGVGVAYYNTSSLGYDNANLISFNSEEIAIMDFNITYDEIKEKIETIKNAVPNRIITI